MFRAILFTQWKWARIALMLGAVVAFGLPLVLAQPLPGLFAQDVGSSLAIEYLGSFGALFPLLATLLGLLLAVSAWAADHAGRHVYALSLPLPRWQLVLYRLGSGLTLLALPLLALWIGALLAVSILDLPEGLRAYPTLLALRFALAALVAFALFFSISAGTTRTAGVVLGTIVGIFLAQWLFALVDSDVNLLGTLIEVLFAWPGPLDIFSGRWMLIDV
jgi:hypothetical protein